MQEGKGLYATREEVEELLLKTRELADNKGRKPSNTVKKKTPTKKIVGRFVYGLLLLGLCGAWLWGVTHRSELIAEVLRDRNALYRDTADGAVSEAFAPQSVTLRLDDEIDVTRGELIAGVDDPPVPTQDLDGMVAWLSERPLRVGQKVLVKQA